MNVIRFTELNFELRMPLIDFIKVHEEIMYVYVHALFLYNL